MTRKKSINQVFRDPAVPEVECWRAMLDGVILPARWNSKGAALAGLETEQRRRAARSERPSDAIF